MSKWQPHRIIGSPECWSGPALYGSPWFDSPWYQMAPVMVMLRSGLIMPEGGVNDASMTSKWRPAEGAR